MKSAEEKKEEEKLVCANLKQTCYVVCRATLGKILEPIYKKDMRMRLYMFLMFLSMILVDM